MPTAEEIPLFAVPHRVSSPSRARRGAVLVAGLAMVVLVAAVVVVSRSTTAQPESLSSDSMLEPYFAWQASEKRAAAQQSSESASLAATAASSPSSLTNSILMSPDDDTLFLSNDNGGDNSAEMLAEVSPPAVHVAKSSVQTEMAAEFKDRDLLAAIKTNLLTQQKPRAALAAKETQEDAEAASLAKQIEAVGKQRAALEARLRDAEEQADPLLHQASGLYRKAHGLEEQYESGLTEAKDLIATGKADLAKQAAMKHEFFAQQQPVQSAQEAQDEADFRYRQDALKFASAMLNAQKMGKNTKLRAAAEKKLNSLREKLNIDGEKRSTAAKKLEAAQGDMTETAGLQDYNRWKLRGQQLINQGKTMMGEAHELKERADVWKKPLDRAQAAAAKAETKVHQIRDEMNKASKDESTKMASRAAALAAKERAAARLQTMETQQVALRQKGMQLMKQYHELKSDIKGREKERARKMASQAEENQTALESLVKSDD